MAYIGSIPAYQASGVRPRDEFTCDGTQICFALSQTVPGSFESSVTVVLDNVPQQPVEAFTVVDTKTLTFSAVTGTFTVNETVTGGTSTATGTVLKVNIGSIVIRQLTGTFTNSETVTGGTSSASATNSAVDTNSGGGILFSEAPAASAILYVVHEGNATYDLIPSAASVGPNQLTDNLKNFTVDTFTGNASTVAFTLSATPASANSILVMVDGIVQTRTTNYTLAGAVVTFTDPPDSSSAITVIHLGFSTTSRTGLVDGSVTTAKIADGAITSAKILDGTIATADIADGAITSSKILDGTIATADIADGAITTSKIADGSVTPAKLANSGAELGMRNRIINGGMTVAQRGTSFTNPNGYTLDRYLFANGSATTVIQQSTNVPSGSGFSYSLFANQGATTWSPSGNQWQGITQAIEGYNFADMMFGTASAKSFTVSFWVYASQTGAYNFACSNASTADFGSATVTRSYVTTYTVNTANTWQYVTITVPGDTSGTWIGATNASAIVVFFNLGSSSGYNTATTNAWQTGKYAQTAGAVSQSAVANSTFYLTGIQLEKGSTATPFDFRRVGQELMLCQRYLPTITSYLANNNTYSGTGHYKNNTTAVQLSFSFLVPARIPPTGFTVGSGASFTIISPAAVNAFACTSPALNSAGFTWALIDATVASGVANTPLYWLINGGANANNAYFTGAEL